MEFNEIRFSNFNTNPKCDGVPSEKTPPAQNNPEQNTSEAKAPVNPKYWQSYSNVTFRGSNENEPSDIEEYKEEIFQKIKGYMYWLSYDEKREEKYASFRENLDILAPFGKQALDSYYTAITRAHSLEPKYVELIKSFYSDLKGRTEESKQKIDSVIETVRMRDWNDSPFDKKISYIDDIMNLEGVLPDDKTFWLYLNKNKIVEIKDEYIKDPDEIKKAKSFFGASKYFDDDKKESLYKCGFSGEQYENLAYLFENDIMKPDLFSDLMSAAVNNYRISNEDEQRKILGDMIAKIKNNPDSAEYISRLISKRISREKLTPSFVDKTVFDSDDEKDAYKKDLIFYFTNDEAFNKYPLFSNEKDLEAFFEIINNDNLEDFKNLSETEHLYGAEQISHARYTRNPKTGLFDVKISNKISEFKKRNPELYKTEYFANTAREHALACIDETTGEFSPAALEFMDKYVFKDAESGVIDKLKSAFPLKKKKTYLRNTPIYEQIEFNWNIKSYLDFLKDNQGAVSEKNYKALSKLIEMHSNMPYGAFEELLPLLKDENGVVDKDKYALTYRMMKTLNGKNSYKYTAINMDRKQTFERVINTFDSLPREKAKEILAFSKSLYPLNSFMGTVNFPAVREICFDESGDVIKENLDFMKKLISVDKSVALNDETVIQTYKAFLDGTLGINNLKFKTKVQLMGDLLKIKSKSDPLKDARLIEKIDKTTAAIDSVLNSDNISLPVPKKAAEEFFNDILSSNNVTSNGLTEFENVMISSIPKLKEMKEGAPLVYSRKHFLEDLSKICDTEEKINILKEKTEITPLVSYDGKTPKINGYEGIIHLDKLNRDDEFQNALYQICHKFLYENEINSGNKELDKFLNTIIKASPEFINTIGKPQHGTHKYTLDIHQLLVLANSINNPDYNKLNNTDKTMLKLSTIFHDIAKEENKVDKGHQFPSSLYARSIIKKFFKNPESRDRVYELIKNHHWLEEFSNSNNKEEISKDLAYRFRRPNDFEIAKIMAKSDLMSVSDEFYESHKSALEDEKLNLIEERLEHLYSTGCAIISDYFINKDASKIEAVNYKGKEYKTVNFHNISDDEDLGKYGFMPGRTKKDINFLVHMVDTNSAKENLMTLKHLSSPVNGGVLSESLITPYYKRTYCDRKYGVMLSQINANVVNAREKNQGSGYEKDFSNILNLVFGYASEQRKKFRNEFLLNLGIDPNAISDKEFAEFYRENIVSKTAFSQFASNREYKLGNKTVTGEDIKQAIIKFQDSLIDKKEENHNEIVGYVPKIQAVIAKEKSIDKVPDDVLEFAHENNLPVVLI